MTNKSNKSILKLSKRVDVRQLSDAAKEIWDKMATATKNFTSTDAKSEATFMKFYNALLDKKPVAVKGTKENTLARRAEAMRNYRKNKKEGKVRQPANTGTGSERDAARKSKPVGWRLRGDSNRKPTNKEKKNGDAYYEGRTNRSDVNRRTMPYLKDGGPIEGDFNFKSFTLNDLRDYLRTELHDIEIYKFNPVDDKDSIARPNFKKYGLNILSMGYAPEIRVERGDENIYCTLRVFNLDTVKNEEFYLELYTKENHAGLKELASQIIKKFKDGGEVVVNKEDGLLHAIQEFVSSGTIGSMTGLSTYKDIGEVRYTAMQILMRDGDRPYSLGALKTLLEEAELEWKENKHGGHFAKGGAVGKTKKEYEEYLNELGIPDADLQSEGGRIPDNYANRYGEWLRKHDTIAFNAGYNEWTHGDEGTHWPSNTIKPEFPVQDITESGVAKYTVRKDILKKGQKVPVGNTYVGEGEYEGKWFGEDEDEFKIKLKGKWEEAESIDWDMIEGPEFAKGGKVSTAIDRHYKEMPVKVAQEHAEYWGNKKMAWNKKEITLGKDDLKELEIVQKYIHKYFPQFDHYLTKQPVNHGLKKFKKGGEISGESVKTILEKIYKHQLTAEKGYFPSIDFDEKKWYLCIDNEKGYYFIKRESKWRDVGSSYIVYNSDLQWKGSADYLTGFKNLKEYRITKEDIANIKFVSAVKFAKGGAIKAHNEKKANLAYQLQNADAGWIKNNPEKFKQMQDEYQKFAKGGKIEHDSDINVISAMTDINAQSVKEWCETNNIDKAKLSSDFANQKIKPLVFLDAFFDDPEKKKIVIDKYSKTGNSTSSGAPKTYYEQDNIGKVKYTVSFHDGVDTFKDGSPFFGIRTFSNKKLKDEFIAKLVKEGYTYKYKAGGHLKKFGKGGETAHPLSWYKYETPKVTIQWKGRAQPMGRFKSAEEALQVIKSQVQSVTDLKDYKIVTPDGVLDVPAEFAKGGATGPALYVAQSSWFDYGNPYDTAKITSALEKSGASDIHLENLSGQSNLPEVVVFKGNRNKALEELHLAFNTEWINVYEKDWRNTKLKKFAKGGDLKNATYVPNRDINELTVVLKGQLKTVKGSDVLDGVYLKKFKKEKGPFLKNQKVDSVFTYLIGKLKKKTNDEKDWAKLKITDVDKLLNAGYTEEQIDIIYFGYKNAGPISIQCDIEEEEGILDYGIDYIPENINRLIDAKKNNEYQLMITYPNFDWKEVIKKYAVQDKSEIIKIENKSDNYNFIYHYQIFKGKNVVFGRFLYRETWENGKLQSSHIDKSEIIQSYLKQTPYQKERDQKPGFNSGFWQILSSKISIVEDIAKILTSQKDGYVKSITMYADRGSINGKNMREKGIKFAKGGSTSATNIKFKPGDIVYVFQHHSDPRKSEYANNKEEREEYDAVPKKYIVGTGNSTQKWCKVKIIEIWSDEKGWEKYKVEQLDGYRKDKQFIAYQDQMVQLNSTPIKPVSIGYLKRGGDTNSFATGGRVKSTVHRAYQK